MEVSSGANGVVPPRTYAQDRSVTLEIDAPID